MTPEECVVLTAYVEELCPHQKINENTPDAWYDVLAPWSLADCREAVKVIVSSGKPFVGVAEIITEVRRLRSRRLESDALALPAANPDQPQDWARALRTIRRGIGDGRQLFRAIEGGTTPQASEDATSYHEIREEWQAERRAKREAERAERERQLAEQEAERSAQQEYIDAAGFLLTLTPDAQSDAFRLATAELGSNTSRRDLTIRAAELADVTAKAPAPDTASMAALLNRRGCPNGCPLGTHDPPCRYATTEKLR